MSADTSDADTIVRDAAPDVAGAGCWAKVAAETNTKVRPASMGRIRDPSKGDIVIEAMRDNYGGRQAVCRSPGRLIASNS
jgi:hypothetical protein